MRKQKNLSLISSDLFYRLVRWALALIFLYAAGSKLLDPKAFAVLIKAYGILPGNLLMPVAIGLPLLEVVAAIGLIFDVRGSLTVISGLLAIFIAILLYGIRMGLDVDCGCFGPEDIESRAYHGLRNALNRDLIMAGGIVYLYAWRRFRSIHPIPVRALFDSLRKERSRCANGIRLEA